MLAQNRYNQVCVYVCIRFSKTVFHNHQCMYTLKPYNINNAQFRTTSVSSYIMYIFWSCDKVYHAQEVRFLLYVLGQIFTLQLYYP